MLQNIFRNMQPVVKNLLIINLLFFLADYVAEQQGVILTRILGLFYVGSSEFRPFQLATHFFMHADLFHILFNMIALVVFGNMLERIWGAKRFLIFYFVTALGAALLHQVVQGIEIYNATGSFFPDLDQFFTVSGGKISYLNIYDNYLTSYRTMHIPVVGASGAVFGLLAGAALYFPNTEVYLYGALPVKIKWLALGLGVFEIYAIIRDSPTDSVAHFAHIGGALFGFILIKIWQRSKTNFY